MAFDPTINFGKVEVSIGYDAAATSIVLASGEGAKLPSTFSYNVIWYNSTDFTDPSEDPNVEIVRVTARTTDTLTVTRAQESTSATTKNTGSKTYKMILGITKKMIDDIDANKVDADGTVPMTGAFDEAKGSDIASATTTDIGAATGNFAFITGTTTITGLGTVQAGTRRIVKFAGILILTHNATSLILPTAANITTAADDRAEFVSLGSGNWICTSYMRADGTALASAGGGATTALSVDAYRSSDQNIGASFENVIFDTEVTDVDGEYNNTTGVFTANGAGLRMFVFNINIDKDNSTSFDWAIEHNGTDVTGGNFLGMASSATRNHVIPFNIILADSDTIEFEADTTASPGSQISGGATAPLRSRIRVHKIT